MLRHGDGVPSARPQHRDPPLGGRPDIHAGKRLVPAAHEVSQLVRRLDDLPVDVLELGDQKLYAFDLLLHPGYGHLLARHAVAGEFIVCGDRLRRSV